MNPSCILFPSSGVCSGVCFFRPLIHLPTRPRGRLRPPPSPRVSRRPVHIPSAWLRRPRRPGRPVERAPSVPALHPSHAPARSPRHLCARPRGFLRGDGRGGCLDGRHDLLSGAGLRRRSSVPMCHDCHDGRPAKRIGSASGILRRILIASMAIVIPTGRLLSLASSATCAGASSSSLSSPSSSSGSGTANVTLVRRVAGYSRPSAVVRVALADSASCGRARSTSSCDTPHNSAIILLDNFENSRNAISTARRLS